MSAPVFSPPAPAADDDIDELTAAMLRGDGLAIDLAGFDLLSMALSQRQAADWQATVAVLAFRVSRKGGRGTRNAQAEMTARGLDMGRTAELLGLLARHEAAALAFIAGLLAAERPAAVAIAQPAQSRPHPLHRFRGPSLCMT